MINEIRLKRILASTKRWVLSNMRNEGLVVLFLFKWRERQRDGELRS